MKGSPVDPLQEIALEDIRDRSLSGYHTPIHQNQPVTELRKQIDMVIGSKHADSLFHGQLPDKLIDMPLVRKVQICGRFVQNQELGLLSQGACYLGSLPLSTTEGTCGSLLQTTQPYPIHGPSDGLSVYLSVFQSHTEMGMPACRDHLPDRPLKRSLTALRNPGQAQGPPGG